MLRQNEWHFIESGRLLERTENTVRILQSVASGSMNSVADSLTEAESVPYPSMLAVLKSVSGYQAFRRFYADGMSEQHIMEFMINGESFPRSIQFSFTELEKHLKGIQLEANGQHLPHEKAIRQAGKMRAELACLESEDFTPGQVTGILGKLTSSCLGLGATMAAAFFQIEEASA
jgi:uncharacterized alpha-E superfamily protein